MRARDKYRQVFGQIHSLAEPIPWTTGLSNMLEWLTWSTNDVLGVTKTTYWKRIVTWCDEASADADLDERKAFVKAKLTAEIKSNDPADRYARPRNKIAGPREALRRAKYFSEDYLNKEFDIFWTLVSDDYLDAYYRQFTTLKGGGSWATHGNSGIFGCSVDISEMQMDNLAYNADERLLVANELKLGGKKNPDQILKYAFLVNRLKERGFIDPDARFLLLFISDKPESLDIKSLIEQELAYCRKSSKWTSDSIQTEECIDIARKAEYAATTWQELAEFNEQRINALADEQQVERKLLSGFNQSLSQKHFLQVQGRR